MTNTNAEQIFLKWCLIIFGAGIILTRLIVIYEFLKSFIKKIKQKQKENRL